MKMINVKPLNDEHDSNIVSMNFVNIHDANDMQCHKLGDAMFDEDYIFSVPSFDEQIYYDDVMPPIYDDYGDDMYDIKNNDNHETSHHDFNFQLDYASHDSYFVEFAPTTIDDKKFAYVESNKFSMHVMKRMLYVMVILLNFFMMLLKIIMGEGLILVGIAIISSFISMC